MDADDAHAPAQEPADGPETEEPDDEIEPEPAEAEPPGPAGTTGLPPKMEAWRRRSAAGAVLTGFALGLQEALESRQEKPAIVMQTSGDPPEDLPVEAEFEYGRPRQSVVQIRPWLLGEGGHRSSDATAPSPGGTADEDAGIGSVDQPPAGPGDQPPAGPGDQPPAGGPGAAEG